jgi:hypothetical protein
LSALWGPAHAILLNWLTRHYTAVRVLSGLSTLAPTDGVPPEVERDLRLANTMITLLEFAESRSSDRTEKKQLRRMQRLVERGV